MKVDHSRAIWMLFGGLLLAGAVYIGLNWYEIAERRHWVGAEGEAARDPYLAMKRLLASMGAKMVTLNLGQDLDRLPGNATLFLGDRRLSTMPPDRVARLVAWVQAGGHLIVEAEQPTLDDPVLAAFGLGHVGLRLTKSGFVEHHDRNVGKGDEKGKAEAKDEDEDEGQSVNAESLPGGEAGQALRRRLKLPLKLGTEATEVVFPGGASFKVVFTAYQNLRYRQPRQGAVEVRDQTGLRLVHFAEGKGRLTAISNFDFMTWRALTREDHAEFLWYLIKIRDDSATPLVLTALRSPDSGLWKWLAAHAWMALLALLALLIFWLMRMMRRFGPLLPEAPMARLSLSEHLDAMGHYIGRGDGWAPLLKAARERFIARLHRERSALYRADPATLAAALEQMSGIGAARIHRALTQEANNRRSFGEIIRTLRALEHSMSSAARSTTTATSRPRGN
ncbi:MAG TPA: DUF4350 domain-containing protein [Usitatibacteraceae bacterium]